MLGWFKHMLFLLSFNGANLLFVIFNFLLLFLLFLSLLSTNNPIQQINRLLDGKHYSIRLLINLIELIDHLSKIKSIFNLKLILLF
jgi:hypothetical protein